MLKLKIVSPERVEFEGEVKRVKVPGTLGQFEILEHHAPIISSLNAGIVSYETAEDTKSVQIQAGFVAVKKNEVSVCVEL